MATRVITGEVRLSWPELFTPRRFQEDPSAPLKYSTMILIPKSDAETMNKIRAAESKELEAGKASVFKGKPPKNPHSIFKDGDEDAEEYPERKGHWYATVSTSEKYKPGVVNANLEPIMDQAQIYSGVYARVSITAFPFVGGDRKGVSFGLNNVQVIRDGENLAGGVAAEDEFDAIADADLI